MGRPWLTGDDRARSIERAQERCRASKRRQAHRRRKRGLSRLAAWVPKKHHDALKADAAERELTLDEMLALILRLRYDRKAP